MSKKLLVVFDFDHTIIDGNSDTIVRDLLSNQPLHEPTECWTTYMQNIFNLLHEEGIDEPSYLNAISSIPPTPGMYDLLHFLDNPNVEVIIISDSNSVFIEMWLNAFKMTGIIKKVFTNPGSFEPSGMLKISMHHHQNWCKICPLNLCKGSVLNEHLKTRDKEGVKFSSVVYVGDGKNDYCPITKLSDADYGFVRKGYSLEKLIDNLQKQEGSKDHVTAHLSKWISASEIEQTLAKLL